MNFESTCIIAHSDQRQPLMMLHVHTLMYMLLQRFLIERICFRHMDLFQTVATVDSPFCTNWMPIYRAMKHQNKGSGRKLFKFAHCS